MADQLLPIPIINPAIQGLNKAEQSRTTLGPAWALEAQNCLFDEAQRLAARKGWVAQAVTPMSGSPNVEQVHEFVKADGTVNVVSAAGSKLWSGVTAFTDITGAVVPTANNWQFVNFVDKVLGWQAGNTPIVWTGAGNFAVLVAASGAVPTGNAVCAAFGRLWAVDADGYTIKYTGLLDETNWGAAGSGSISMRSVWTQGTDTVIAIAAFGSRLVVFGNRHIVAFQDGSNSLLGLDPTKFAVTDTIEGSGLVARDSVKPVNEGDVLFLSPQGVQSLARAIVQKNLPLDSLDSQIRDYVASYLPAETVSKIRATFAPSIKAYLLLLPVAGRIFYYDTLHKLDDGRLRTTEWIYTTILPKSISYRANGDLLFGFNGNLGLYTGYKDNDATSYRYVFNSAWLTGASQANPELETKLKILKRLGYVVFATNTILPVFKWGYDFAGLNYSATPTITGGSTPEYGTAEYGTNGKYNVNDPLAVAGVNYSEYGGSLTLRVGRQPGSSLGRWIQFGVEADINGGAFAIQELDAYCKITRKA